MDPGFRQRFAVLSGLLDEHREDGRALARRLLVGRPVRHRLVDASRHLRHLGASHTFAWRANRPAGLASRSGVNSPSRPKAPCRERPDMSTLPKDCVRADTQPRDMHIAWARRCSVPEERAAIVRPGHLEHAEQSLITLHSQAGPKPPTGFQVNDHVGNGRSEAAALFRRQLVPVTLEPGDFVMSRHYWSSTGTSPSRRRASSNSSSVAPR